MAEELGPEAKPDTSYGAAKLNTGRACPACGVRVAPGYPKCPKCHAEMPQEPRPATGAPLQGGTSVAAEGAPMVWIAGGAALAAIIAIVVIAGSGGDDAPAAVGADGGDVAEVEADDEPVVVDDDDDDFFDDVDDEAAAADEARKTAVTALGRALNGQRVWSQVSVNGTTAVLETDFCEDETLVQVVDDARDQLKAAGFGAIQCYSKFGVLVFERTY